MTRNSIQFSEMRKSILLDLEYELYKILNLGNIRRKLLVFKKTKQL